MQKYDTFWQRFKAGIIDSTILLPFAILDHFILQERTNLGISIAWMFFSYSSFYIYSIYFHWKSGQTIGKKAMNIQVVDVSENRGLTFKQAFLRDSIYIMIQVTVLVLITIKIIQIGVYSNTGTEPYSSYLTIFTLFWFLLELVTMLTNKKRRALHDYMASTVVLDKWKGEYT